MKILITGATGFVGKALCERLIINGYDLVVLSRSASRAREQMGLPAQYFTWANPVEDLPPVQALKNVDAVIHLMGQNLIGKRWTKSVKASIYNSRIDSLKNLGRQFQAMGVFPSVVVSSSAVGIYGDRGAESLDESSGQGAGFLAVLCADWERSAKEFFKESRVVSLRTGIVFERDGGVLEKLYTPCLLNSLGTIGWGKNWQSWIHREDLISIFIESIENEEYQGAINAVSPNPVLNLELTKRLCQKAHRLMGPPLPIFVLKLLFGEMAQVLYSSAKVMPRRLVELGFKFNFETMESALDQIYQRSFPEKVYIQRQWFPHKSKKLFKFFTDIRNLEKITPNFLQFNLIGMNTLEIQNKTLIDYKLKIHGWPIDWRSQIIDWSPPAYFVDNQVKGPYKTWHHRHLLIELNNGTLIKDIIFYELPLNTLSMPIAGKIVKRDVEKIFSFRFERLEKIFGHTIKQV